VIRTAPPAGEELAEGEPFLMVVSEGPVLRPLPELNGLSFADAQTAVVAAGLVAVPVEQYDEVVPAGQVISWSVPADPSLVAGSEVEPGTEVQIVSSLGPAPRTVPDLAGVGFTDAQAVLAPLGLALAESEQVFSDTVPAGAIVSQTPAAGEIVERGATISVQVSKGPDVVTLPDLSGQTYDQAAATLQAAGFTPVLVFGASDGVFQSAAVGGQPASAGDVFPRGTTVELTHL
jgi:serine/threonine-protein kinase